MNLGTVPDDLALRLGCEYELLIQVPSLSERNGTRFASILDSLADILNTKSARISVLTQKKSKAEVMKAAGSLIPEADRFTDDNDTELRRAREVVDYFNTILTVVGPQHVPAIDADPEQFAKTVSFIAKIALDYELQRDKLYSDNMTDEDCNKFNAADKVAKAAKEIVPEIGMINEFAGEYRDYSKWSITNDTAIQVPLEKKGTVFGFEMVGPIMDISPDPDTQRRAIFIIWDFFTWLTDVKYCHCVIIPSNVSTSTHIHVSIGSAKQSCQWQLDDIKKVLCSGYFWDPCIRYLLPAWRRLRQFAGDTRANDGNAPYFKYPEAAFRNENFPRGRFLRSTWDDPLLPAPYLKCTKVDVRGNLQQIIDLQDFNAVKGLHHQNRNVGWNVQNLSENPSSKKMDLGTIEFRRPSASTYFGEAVCWLELTYAFFRAAIKKGTPNELMAINTPDMDAFQAWLKDDRFGDFGSVGRVLDAKFSRAKQRGQMRLYLTDEEERTLQMDREEHLRRLLDGDSPRQPTAASAEETLSVTARELVSSAKKELKYVVKAQKAEVDQIMKSIKDLILSRESLLM